MDDLHVAGTRTSGPSLSEQKMLHFLHIFYVGYFALILPFICWGAQATPGHLHTHAHFVFGPPSVPTHTAQQVLSESRTRHGCGSPIGSAVSHYTTNKLDAKAVPTGRSIPSTIISTILLSPTLGRLTIIDLLPAVLMEHLPTNNFKSIDSPVPTRPPRLLVWTSFQPSA